jgi:hypothetical protein
MEANLTGNKRQERATLTSSDRLEVQDRPIAAASIPYATRGSGNLNTIFPMAAILALAALVRIAAGYYEIDRPSFEKLMLSGNEEVLIAQSLLAGHGFSSPFGGSTGPTAYLAPGYPLLVAGVFRLFGSPSSAAFLSLFLLQVAFSLATIAVMIYIARKVFGKRTATIAGVAYAFCPPTIVMPCMPWDTCLSALLLIGSVALALQCGQQPKTITWVLMGGMTAFTGLINPSLLPALIAMMAWCACRSADRSADRQRGHAKGYMQPTLAVLTLLLIFAPWPVRNLKVMHAFIPLRSNLGYELWNGNLPEAGGEFIRALHPLNSKVEFARYAALGEVAYMNEKTALAESAIKADPARFVRISFKRIWYFWFGMCQLLPDTSTVIVLQAVLTTISGAAGLLLVFRKSRPTAWLFMLPLLFFPLPYYVTHPDQRFRLLLDPLLMVLGSYAVVRLWDRLTVKTGDALGLSKNTLEEVVA